MKCWGANEHGQLGDNSSNYRFSPVDVVGLASGVVAITGGGAHTCALTAVGGVKCWGWNGAGALGNGSTADSWIPVDVTGLASGVAAIAAGAEHTCANTRAGTVKCWGWNFGGQLGNNNAAYPPALTPVDVQGLPIATTAVAAGGMHSCALNTASGVVCWGLDNFGQLGDNSIVERLTPVGVPGLASGVSAISGTYGRICVVTASGGVKCWGGNYFTRLPGNSWGQPLTPVDVPELATGVTAIATGRAHACVLTTAGGVKCWGEGFNSDWVTPIDMPGLASGVTSIAAGDDHTCALATSGGVKCWGANEHGQLGDNSTSYRLAPVDVTGLASGVVAIGAGEARTCAVTASGGAKCWGENSSGQLGDGSTTDRLTPVDVSGLASGVAAIAPGGGHTCAITTAGAAKCWGDNEFGQLGDNSTVQRLTPVDVSGLGSGVAAISAGKYFHTCAITTSGGAKCWGGNGYGMLGDNSTLLRSVPVDVAGLATGVTAISAGGHHTCALVGAGEVKCWGSNFSGELGDGGAGFRPYPVEVLTQPGGQ